MPVQVLFSTNENMTLSAVKEIKINTLYIAIFKTGVTNILFVRHIYIIVLF